MSTEIKVGFCTAYDWHFLKLSLPLIYEEADLICISIDRDRISWAGKPFVIDEEAFAAFLKEIDPDGKILLYEDDFHQADLNAMENDVRQRNLMAKAMGKGGWHLQLDSDEYFIDFPGFVHFLKTHSYNRPVNIECPMLVLFKSVQDGFLHIENKTSEQAEFFAIATNEPKYEHSRRNGYFNIKTNFPIVHQSWARDEEEIEQKIHNWGHKDDFDVQAYFNRWKALDEQNHKDFVNFHPICPESWAMLKMVKAASIAELIQYFRLHPPFHFSPKYLRKANSIWYSRLNAVLKKLG